MILWKKKQTSSCGPFPACPLCALTALSPPRGFLALCSWFSIPASLFPTSLSCPQAHTALPGLSWVPPSLWPTSSSYPQQDRHLWYNFACGVFFCKHLICAGADPGHDQRKHLPLPCPPVPALGEIDGNCPFAFYLFSFSFFFPVHFLWSVLSSVVTSEYVTSCDAVDSVWEQWRRGHFSVR